MAASEQRWIGYVLLFGSAVAILLAPLMVAIKYMTGWAVIPEPFWVAGVTAALRGAFPTATPAELWMGFGTGYSVALFSMLCGLVALGPQLQGPTRAQRAGYWLLAGGLVVVLPGDAIHSWTWHQNGLTIPTPGSNPVANTAYAAHMLGMNSIMAGSLLLGTIALRRRTLARWVAWLCALVFPAALLASLTLLPTSPSGALWLFSVLLGLCGYQIARGRRSCMVAA